MFPLDLGTVPTVWYFSFCDKSNRKIVEIKGKIKNTTLSEQFLNLIEKS
jgi:hypothetical protein